MELRPVATTMQQRNENTYRIQRMYDDGYFVGYPGYHEEIIDLNVSGFLVFKSQPGYDEIEEYQEFYCTACPCFASHGHVATPPTRVGKRNAFLTVAC